MSDHWPFRSVRPTAESDATASWSENGVSPEDTVGVPDTPAVEAVATDGEPAPEPSAVEVVGEASTTTAVDDTTRHAEPTAVDDAGAAAAAEDDAVFLAELVRTVQTTAGLERVRIAEETERRRQAHIDRIRTRQASEETRLRELAGEDMKAIDAWADGEANRIQRERERRATKRQENLETSLADHNAKIDYEIERIERAIAAYRADIDVFFGGLDTQTDLIQIAKQATRRPVFPTLDAVAENGGQTGPAPVGVMDPQAAAEAAESWAATPATSPESAPAGASDDVDQAEEARDPAEAVTTLTDPSPDSSRSLFQSVPAHRPMSRVRRDSIDPDRSDRES